MTYQYDTREVTHGNANGFYAKIAKTDAGALDLQKPYPFTGLRSTSFETSHLRNQMPTMQTMWNMFVCKVKNPQKGLLQPIRFLNSL
ncbi:TPA: hypothetical protein ACGAU0_000592 [Streptococcus agalactiae]